MGKNEGDYVNKNDQIYFQSNGSWFISNSNGTLSAVLNISESINFDIIIDFVDSNLFIENYSVKMPETNGNVGEFLKIKSIINNNAHLEWTSEGAGLNVTCKV